MAPPLFADLGKNARDVFSKGYNFGHVRVDTTTRSGDFDFKTNCMQNIGTGKLFGGLDVKYRIPNQGLTLSERWNTDNVLSTEVVIDEKLLRGLKLVLDSAYAPYVGKRSGKIKAEFRADKASFGGDIQLDSTGTRVFNGTVVFGHQNWLLGCSTGFDANKNKLTHKNFGVAYDGRELGVHVFANNFNEYGGNIFHRVNAQTDIGATFSWATGENSSRFGIAAKYEVDKDTTLRAKINNQSLLGIGVTHCLKPGLKVILSLCVNVANLNDAGHKVGFGVEYEPPARKI